MKVKWRQARDTRQRLQLERIVQVRSDVLDGHLNGAGVVRACIRFHCLHSRAQFEAVLDIGCDFGGQQRRQSPRGRAYRRDRGGAERRTGSCVATRSAATRGRLCSPRRSLLPCGPCVELFPAISAFSMSPTEWSDNSPRLRKEGASVMSVRFSVTCALVVLLTASTLAAQTRDSKTANAATPATTGKTWTPDKTPWGDPDLQAVWSGDSAFGIPL